MTAPARKATVRPSLRECLAAAAVRAEAGEIDRKGRMRRLPRQLEALAEEWMQSGGEIPTISS